MITLEVYQGAKFTRVLQAQDRGGNPPLYFLATDALTSAVWDGQTQAVLFSPAVQWFMGLAEITVTNGGTGYSPSPVITVSGGGATADATGVATVIGGTIVEITIANPGNGYTSAPTITITDATGTGATATATPALGWKDGQILVEMSAAQTADLDTMGQYRFRATATRLVPTALIDCLIRVYPSAGASTQTIQTYCSYQDMLDIAPWIAGIQDVDTDLEGFYSQRLKARLWFDDIVLNRFQGGYVGSFGAHSNDFGTSGGNSLGPDRTVRDALAANQLMRTPAVVDVCAHYAVALIGLAQLGAGGGMSLAHRGHWHKARAERDVLAITAQIDTNADGQGDMFANLSAVSVTYG